MTSTYACRHCSAPFTPNHHLQKFCTPECRRDHSIPARKLKVCRTCGKEFDGLANQRYCGSPCQAPTAKVAEKRREPFPCARCGTLFVRANAGQRYCSPACRHPKVSKPCAECGKPFNPVAGQRYCGNPCVRPTGLPKKPEPEKPCVRCGKNFEPLTARQKFCSRECREARDQPPKWQLNPDFQYKDSTWRRHVLEMCGNVCVDCGHAAPSLHAHHLIPKARGGKNVVRNGIALCDGCHRIRHDNSMAGDDLVERIALRVIELIDNR